MPQLAMLPKIYADSTSKRFVFVVIAISLVVIGITYGVSTFLLPVPFIVVEGPERCPPNMKNFRGFCHTFPFEKKRTWLAFISHLNEKNSFIAIGANAVRNSKSSMNGWLIRTQIRARILYRDHPGGWTGRSAHWSKRWIDYTHKPQQIEDSLPWRRSVLRRQLLRVISTNPSFKFSNSNNAGWFRKWVQKFCFGSQVLDVHCQPWIHYIPVGTAVHTLGYFNNHRHLLCYFLPQNTEVSEDFGTQQSIRLIDCPCFFQWPVLRADCSQRHNILGCSFNSVCDINDRSFDYVLCDDFPTHLQRKYGRHLNSIQQEEYWNWCNNIFVVFDNGTCGCHLHSIRSRPSR